MSFSPYQGNVMRVSSIREHLLEVKQALDEIEPHVFGIVVGTDSEGQLF